MSGVCPQGRFNDRFLASDDDRRRACDYVHWNPVEADLAASPDAYEFGGGLVPRGHDPGPTRGPA